MTILQKYKVSWFHDLSFKQLKEVLADAEQFSDWNRLGFLRALVECSKLTIGQTVVLREAFKEKYDRYYLHRAFTDTETVAFLEYLDVEDRPEFVGFDRFGRRRTHTKNHERHWSLFLNGDLRLATTEEEGLRPIMEADRFFEAAYQRGNRKVRKGSFHPHPQHRTRTALSDPYEMYFGDAVNKPFDKIDAKQLREKYSYNKRNGSKTKPLKQPNYPIQTPWPKGTKNHKNLYQRLDEKKKRAVGKKIARDWEEE